eukprot:TRINITY_DN29299_c0_g1_i1.p1 TRINITY_DN29299_c0_g1~~TRINITY_DN29299_c0_g1_i1.p1  ORF type:complete len:239 (-),score=25.53 TRINITY_DN29299_c0_g1_i1:159-848(-)
MAPKIAKPAAKRQVKRDEPMESPVDEPPPKRQRTKGRKKDDDSPPRNDRRWHPRARALVLALGKAHSSVIPDLVKIIIAYSRDFTALWGMYRCADRDKRLIFQPHGHPMRLWVTQTSNGWFHVEVKDKVEPHVVWSFDASNNPQSWILTRPQAIPWPDEPLLLNSWTISHTSEFAEIRNSSEPRQRLQLFFDKTALFTSSSGACLHISAEGLSRIVPVVATEKGTEESD